MKRIIRFFILFMYIYLFLFNVSGAIFNIPSLTLITRGIMVDDKFRLSTQGEMDMLIQGGDKFGGQIILGFFSEDLESDIDTGLDGLAFKAANIAVRNLFSSPLTISYFVGENDNFCSGEGFNQVFGTAPIVTSYSGFMYFPEGTVFNGIHTVNGTGIQLSIVPINNLFYSSLYFYQDAFLGSGQYSYDLRMMFNLDKICLDFFAGGSFAISAAPFGYYRAGILFNARSPIGDFIMQLGVPRLDPSTVSPGIDLFYVLFEVNVRLGLLTLVPSVFIHPGYYAQAETEEAGLFDINMNFKIGDIQEHLICGGLETNIAFEEASIEGLTIKGAPYLTLVSPGVEWQFKVNATLFPWPEIDEMFEGFVGIKAVF